MLADSGVLDGGGDLNELAVPTSLQAMIGSRLDGLPRSGQAGRPACVGVPEWSSGRGPSPSSTAARRGRPEPGVAREARFRARKRGSSSVADEREWSFKHALIKDVAYARVPKGRRAQLHVRFADWVTGHPRRRGGARRDRRLPPRAGVQELGRWTERGAGADRAGRRGADARGREVRTARGDPRGRSLLRTRSGARRRHADRTDARAEVGTGRHLEQARRSAAGRRVAALGRRRGAGRRQARPPSSAP